MVQRFQFRPVGFFQCPAFSPPECYIANSRFVEPATDTYRDPFVAKHLRTEPNSLLAWLIRAVMSAVSLSSGLMQKDIKRSSSISMSSVSAVDDTREGFGK
jgi:hypothetical protein